MIKSSTIQCVLIAITLPVLFCSNLIAFDTLRTIALENEPVHGASSGTFYQFFGTPVLNIHGQTAFAVQFTGPAVDLSDPFFSNVFGIVSEGDGNGLELVAQSKSLAPQLGSNVYFMALDEVTLNDNGVAAFMALLTGPGVDTSSNTSNDQAIYKAGPSGLSLVARSGNLAPGTSSVTDFWFFGVVSLTNADQVVFDAALRDSGNRISSNRGIFRENLTGNLELVARNGNAAPGTSPPASFGSMGSHALNVQGDVAFHATLGQNGADSGYFSREVGHSISLRTRIGRSIGPDIPGGSFDGFNGLAFNDRGTIAFRGFFVDQDGVPAGSGIFHVLSNGAVKAIAQSNTPVPGSVASLEIVGFDYRIALNARNQTSFVGALSDGGNALFSTGQGRGLEVVARQGEHAPGTAAYVVFASFLSTASNIPAVTPALNIHGQTAFMARLLGAGPPDTLQFGIFAQDVHGALKLIAQTGGTLDVSDDPLTSDFRTILGIRFDPQRGFNQKGQVAFTANFTDGTSGVFVSDLVAVPEPTTCAIVYVAGICAVLIRRW